MLKPDDYVRIAKERLGNPAMSDRELGERLGGFGFSSISKARYGNMSDHVAIKLAEVIPDIDAGEILMVARLEREKDESVKSVLRAWASKTLASMPERKAEPFDFPVGGMGAMHRKVRGAGVAKNTI